jgi:hypothetical protein
MSTTLYDAYGGSLAAGTINNAGGRVGMVGGPAVDYAAARAFLEEHLSR